jgi:hypothetical protein
MREIKAATKDSRRSSGTQKSDGGVPVFTLT